MGLSPKYNDLGLGKDMAIYLSIYLSICLSIYLYCVILIAECYAQGCMSWRKARKDETNATGRRQPNHIHSDGFFFPYKRSMLHILYDGTVIENVESIKYLGVMICDGIHMSAIFALRLIGPLAS